MVPLERGLDKENTFYSQPKGKDRVTEYSVINANSVINSPESLKLLSDLEIRCPRCFCEIVTEACDPVLASSLS